MNESPMLFVAGMLANLIRAYSLLVLIWIILSWIRVDPANPIVSLLRTICDPPMREIRRMLPFVVVGSLDLSPIVLLFGLQILAEVVLRAAYTLSSH